MKRVSILEVDDKIKSSDWCRPLAQTDSAPETTRSIVGTPENNFKWVRVKDVFGPHVQNRRVRDFIEKIEFVRGKVPPSHVLDMKEYSSVSYLWDVTATIPTKE